MVYDFLKVTDGMMDVQAPQLARLLSTLGRKVSPGEALALILNLERYVMRRANDAAEDLMGELATAGTLLEGRAAEVLSIAVGWPLSKSGQVLTMLADPDVAVLEAVPGGWRVRGLAERYGRFAMERRASRHRTRDNARARAAGWVPGDGTEWVHADSGEVAKNLKDAVRLVEARRAASP